MTSDDAYIVRSYRPQDLDSCLAVFDGNVPEYFALAERNEFIAFLDTAAAKTAYQVIERDGRIVACGGLAMDGAGSDAVLCWGMVAQRLHGAGLGRLLTETRLETARSTPGLERVRIGTSQHTRGFYERFGFVVEEIVPDGYAVGLDRWNMLLRLEASPLTQTGPSVAPALKPQRSDGDQSD